MNTPEKVLCSAVWYKELPLKNPDVLLINGFAPYNIDKGVVFCGWRHMNCIYQMIAIYGMKNHEAGESVQGFLTSKNRFVDREEGAEIHVRNGGKLNYGNQLYSEDIY